MGGKLLTKLKVALIKACDAVSVARIANKKVILFKIKVVNEVDIRPSYWASTPLMSRLTKIKVPGDLLE